MPKGDKDPATRKDFRDLKREVDGIDSRLIRVEKKVVSKDGSLAKTEGRLTKVEKRLEKVESNTERILDVVLELDSKFKRNLTICQNEWTRPRTIF